MLALAAAVVLGACGGDGDSAATSPPATPPPASITPATVMPAVGPLTLDETAAIIDVIAATFEAEDFGPVEELLGETGTWTAIDGTVYDRDTITEFLEMFGFITQIVRNDVSADGFDGYGYEITETFEDGGSATFWIFVARDESGALEVTEQVSPPS